MKNKKVNKLILSLSFIFLLSSCATPTVQPRYSDNISTSTKAGDKEIINFTGKEAKILILGNSFIGSSQVDRFVKMIAEEKNQKLQVDVESRGYYSIEKYYNDIDQLPKVKEGYYDVIFLSGLYGDNDLISLGNFIDAIKTNKTKIAIFPADNEVQYLVTKCKKQYNSVYYADWNLALDDIKTTTVFKIKYLTFDDEYKHSNELGGYIGACVIYSFLYKSMPNCITTAEYMVNNYSSYFPDVDPKDKLEKLKTIDEMVLNIVNKQ